MTEWQRITETEFRWGDIGARTTGAISRSGRLDEHGMQVNENPSVLFLITELGEDTSVKDVHAAIHSAATSLGMGPIAILENDQNSALIKAIEEDGCVSFSELGWFCELLENSSSVPVQEVIRFKIP